MTTPPKEQSHSALPWRITPLGRLVDANGIDVHFPDGNGSTQTDWDNMEIAVEAVNSHARLLAQNEMLRKALEQFAQCNLNDENCASLELASKRVRNIARAALEQTEGE